MSRLDEIKMKIEADRKQDEQRATDLDKIREQIADIDERIDEAIAAEQNSTAEKLIAKQGELKTKMSVMERISAHKTAPDAYYNDLLEICTDYVAEMQPKIDKAIADMEKAHRAYLEKKAALSKMLYDAGNFRAECGTLAGLGALWANQRFDAFPCVKYNQNDLEYTYSEEVIIKEIDPDFTARFNEIHSFVGIKP